MNNFKLLYVSYYVPSTLYFIWIDWIVLGMFYLLCILSAFISAIYFNICHRHFILSSCRTRDITFIMFMKYEVMYWMMLGMDEDQVQSKENVELAWTYIKKNLDFYVIQKRNAGWVINFKSILNFLLLLTNFLKHLRELYHIYDES